MQVPTDTAGTKLIWSRPAEKVVDATGALTLFCSQAAEGLPVKNGNPVIEIKDTVAAKSYVHVLTVTVKGTDTTLLLMNSNMMKPRTWLHSVNITSTANNNFIPGRLLLVTVGAINR